MALLSQDTLAVHSTKSIVLLTFDIDESKQATLLSILKLLFLLFDAVGVFDIPTCRLAPFNVTHSTLVVQLDLSLLRKTFIARTSKPTPFESIAQVRVFAEVDWVIWSTQGFPIQLLNRLHSLEVVFSECWVLPAHNFDIVRLLGVPPRTKEENEALTLQWL